MRQFFSNIKIPNQSTYSFQGQERDDEVKGAGNSYTTYFRQLDPRVGRWLSLDPIIKIDKSPYLSFSNNPNIMVDPKGDDEYTINRKGEISLSKKTDDNFDIISGNDKNGINISILTDKQLMSSVTSSIIIKKELIDVGEGNHELLEKVALDYTINTFKTTEKNAVPLFEFFVDATDVEWSKFSFNEFEGKSNIAIITTSHAESTDGGVVDLKNRGYFLTGILKSFTHNHPDESITPSGFYTDGNEIKTEGDIGAAKGLEDIFGKNTIIFSIYTPKEGYTSFKAKTIFEIDERKK